MITAATGQDGRYCSRPRIGLELSDYDVGVIMKAKEVFKHLKPRAVA